MDRDYNEDELVVDEAWITKVWITCKDWNEEWTTN